MMKRMLALVAGAVLVAGSAWALPFNTRPATGVTNLGGLQSWMDSHSWNANAEDDQSTAAVFAVAPTSNDALFTMVFETGNNAKANNNRFGLYNAKNSSEMFELFPGPASDPGSLLSDALVLSTKSQVGFYAGGFAHVTTTSDVHYGDGSFGTVEYMDIWYSNVDANGFGFYLDSRGTDVRNQGLFFSEDDLNNGGMAQALVYGGMGANAGEWLIAFEHGDRSIASDNDFNDMIIVAQSINPAPVPEPATMLLLGSGLVGLAGVSRRKGKKS